MSTKVIMPKLGLTMVEGTIVKWKKREGEAVKEGDVLFTVETEKITYEVEATQSGILGKIVAAKDDVIPVGGAVAYILEPGEEMAAISELTEEAKVEATAAPTEAVAEAARPKRAELPPEVKISPLARKMAEEHGVDISLLKGTGPGGRIVKEDVLRAVAESKVAAARPVEEAPAAEGRLQPLSSMRRVIAKRMTESFQAPHFYLSLDVDTQELGRALQELIPIVETKTGVRPTYTDLLVKIVARALEDNPSLNCAYADGQVRVFDRIDIGLVTSVEGGLVVPVIRQVNKRSVAEISMARAELIQKAKERKLSKEEITDSTFTISNLGMFGIDQVSPILQPPEGAILGVGRIADRPVVRDGQIVIRPMVTLTLSIDHRVLDGVDGAQFLQSVRDCMENPVLLLS